MPRGVYDRSDTPKIHKTTAAERKHWHGRLRPPTQDEMIDEPATGPSPPGGQPFTPNGHSGTLGLQRVVMDRDALTFALLVGEQLPEGDDPWKCFGNLRASMIEAGCSNNAYLPLQEVRMRARLLPAMLNWQATHGEAIELSTVAEQVKQLALGAGRYLRRVGGDEADKDELVLDTEAMEQDNMLWMVSEIGRNKFGQQVKFPNVMTALNALIALKGWNAPQKVDVTINLAEAAANRAAEFLALGYTPEEMPPKLQDAARTILMRDGKAVENGG